VTEPLEIAAWRLSVGLHRSEDLPSIATDALVRGIDSPSLRELAGQAPRDVRESVDLFVAALDELGIDMPTEQDALWKLAQLTAAQITSGAINAYDGAQWIWWNLSHRQEREGDLRVFIGLASEWDDHPSARGELDAAIVDAARDLLTRAEPRQWVQLCASRGRSPLTASRPVDRVEIEAAELPISRELVRSLGAWSAAYDATFTAEAPGFAAVAEAEAFVRQGRALVDDLQGQLGPTWWVEYMPEPTRPPGLRLRH